VAQRVLELRDEGTDLNKVAVLYRSHFHALELQLELTRRNIPFAITSGIRFFEQAHIKDVTAYLKLVVNPRDELAFKRLVLMMRGIGPKGADKLWRKFGQTVQGLKPNVESPQPAEDGQKVQPDEKTVEGRAPSRPTSSVERRGSRAQSEESRIQNPESGIPHRASSICISAALRAIAEAVPTKAASAWTQFADTVEQLEAEPTRNQPAEMIRVVLEASYEDYLKANYANYRHRLDDLEQLAVFSRQFPSVEEFLTQLALLTNLEAEDQRPVPQSRDSEVLRLSTVHQAKGLEFDVVFVIMMCDGLFPNARALNAEDGEEEERRLFYVAITRAKSELYLSFPFVRAGYNPSGDIVQVPSRFLNEIPKTLVDEWNLRTFVPHG